MEDCYYVIFMGGDDNVFVIIDLRMEENDVKYVVSGWYRVFFVYGVVVMGLKIVRDDMDMIEVVMVSND